MVAEANPLRKSLWLLILLTVAGCEHAIGVNPPELSASCYDGAFTSFCVVRMPVGATVVTGSGVVPTIGQLATGLGNLMIGEGTILNGAAVIEK